MKMKHIVSAVLIVCLAIITQGPHSLIGWGSVIAFCVITFLFQLFSYLSRIHALLQELNRKIDLITKKMQ